MDMSFFRDGSAYERYIGRWSRPVATEFLRWLDPSTGGTWLDVGCGTGALTQEILVTADPARVVGIDPSEAQIEAVREHIDDLSAAFEVGDAMALDLPNETFDFVVSGLVLNFIPDPDQAAREMSRVTKPGGRVAAYVWDYAEGMQMVRYYWDAATQEYPDAAERDAASIFPVCSPEGLEATWMRAGLEDVRIRPIDTPTRFTDFDDYWDPFLSGVGTAPAFNMELDETVRIAIRERLRATLPVGPDGSIALNARAWAVTGRQSGG